jgi:hypothetical protein
VTVLSKYFKSFFSKTSNLTEKFIDQVDGHLLISNDFEVSPKTTPDNLLLYFKEENVKSGDIRNDFGSYIISNVKKGNTYFYGTFYFEKEILSFVSFIIDDKPILTGSWDSWSEKNELQKREYLDSWLTGQVGKKRSFVWGTVGAFYDNKGGQSSIVLRYDKAKS